MKMVARVVLAYIEAVESATTKEADEAQEQDDQDDQGDQGGHDQTQEHFMDYNPDFVYFLYIIQL